MRNQACTAVVMTLALVACGDEDDDNGQTPAGLEIVGEWSSPFSDETITETTWNADTIVEYDNAANEAVTQTAMDAMFNPGKFNKLVWTEPANDSFFYCFVDFGRDTAMEARTSTQTADDSDPSMGGCGGFPWTELTRR